MKALKRKKFLADVKLHQPSKVFIDSLTNAALVFCLLLAFMGALPASAIYIKEEK